MVHEVGVFYKVTSKVAPKEDWEVVENDNQQSKVVEDNTSKVTDEYDFEVFGEEASDKQEEIKKAVEAIPSEQNDSEKMEKLKSVTENAINTSSAAISFNFLFSKKPSSKRVIADCTPV